LEEYINDKGRGKRKIAIKGKSADEDGEQDKKY